jgi:hypothetical protein
VKQRERWRSTKASKNWYHLPVWQRTKLRPPVSDRPQSESKRSEIVYRDTQFYRALPADGTNVTTTEEFLRSKVKNPNDILHHSWDDEITGWYNLELDSETKKEVEAYEGIKAMRVRAKLEQFTAPAKDIPQPGEKRTGLALRDIQWYNASVAKESDVQKTKDFLKSKVQNGTQVFTQEWNGIISGWFNLALDAEAKKEVEEYEGIEHVSIMKDIDILTARPSTRNHNLSISTKNCYAETSKHTWH